MSAVVEALDSFDEVEGEVVVAAGARHRVVLAEEIEVAALASWSRPRARAVVAVAPRADEVAAPALVQPVAAACEDDLHVVPVPRAVVAVAPRADEVAAPALVQPVAAACEDDLHVVPVPRAVVAVAPRRAFEVVLNFADAARRSVGVVPVLLAVAAEAAPAYIAAVLRRGVAVLVPGGPTVRAARGLQQWLDREG